MYDCIGTVFGAQCSVHTMECYLEPVHNSDAWKFFEKKEKDEKRTSSACIALMAILNEHFYSVGNCGFDADTANAGAP